ncbi:uncharacterized protein DEA37_0006700, partial [Paragonimus westermani]
GRCRREILGRPSVAATLPADLSGWWICLPLPHLILIEYSAFACVIVTVFSRIRFDAPFSVFTKTDLFVVRFQTSSRLPNICVTF